MKRDKQVGGTTGGNTTGRECPSDQTNFSIHGHPRYSSGFRLELEKGLLNRRGYDRRFCRFLVLPKPETFRVEIEEFRCYFPLFGLAG